MTDRPPQGAGDRPKLPAGVAAGHPDTARVGRDVLRRGGSAADAAAAMVLAGCVAETIFTGLAGGGFATVYQQDTGAVTCIDFFVSVPGLDGSEAGPATTIAVSFGGVAVPYAVGGPTVAVPGTPAGVAALHGRFGRLPWHEIVGPAVRLAEAGSPFSQAHADLLPDVAAAMVLGDGIGSYSRTDLVTGQRLLSAGERLHHPGLAGTLQVLADQGPDAFYTGPVGRALVAAVRADGGALSLDDLAAYRVIDLPVHRVPFAGLQLSARGNDLDGFAETARRLDVAAVAAGGVPRARALVAALRAPALRSETTSLVAVDSDGNACVVTHSLGLGSGVWVGGMHGNSMLGEGELLRGPLTAGARMPSMMVPSVVTDDAGALVVAGGAAGGSRIRPALLQVLSGLLVQGLDAPTAVAAPRLSASLEAVHLEPGLGPVVAQALRSDGHTVVEWEAPRPYFGGVSVAAGSGPAADPRRGGLALTVR
ncbi:gamma-glutamyltransferase [Nakamurella endophytica]|uniref:Gamma-glutamyltranspeptidase n=1 Tax=Nakamurella endophytica TaxID=1748367 RepID=A0A917STR5_9ACTN|nr:gamma-glutamyltransferase [Nakamurella endophytica]GGL95314.1 hypothetical protein GCM10011594_13700 [Nakamurella endophytica]